MFFLFHFPERQCTPPGLVDLRSGFSTWSGCRRIFRFGAFLISSLNCYLSMTFALVPVSGSTSTFAPFLEILQLFFLALGCAVRCTSMCCIIRAISLLIEIDLLSELLYVLSELSSWCPCRTWWTRLRRFCLWHDFPALRDSCDVTFCKSSWHAKAWFFSALFHVILDTWTPAHFRVVISFSTVIAFGSGGFAFFLALVEIHIVYTVRLSRVLAY